jgi:hypothetical protein
MRFAQGAAQAQYNLVRKHRLAFVVYSVVLLCLKKQRKSALFFFFFPFRFFSPLSSQ